MWPRTAWDRAAAILQDALGVVALIVVVLGGVVAVILNYGS